MPDEVAPYPVGRDNPSTAARDATAIAASTSAGIESSPSHLRTRAMDQTQAAAAARTPIAHTRARNPRLLAAGDLGGPLCRACPAVAVCPWLPLR